MGKTNTLIFLSISLKQTKAGPRSPGTPFLVLIYLNCHPLGRGSETQLHVTVNYSYLFNLSTNF